MVNVLEIRRLIHKDEFVVEEEIAHFYINQNIIHNKNVLIPRLFNKIWNILSNIRSNPKPEFYFRPYPVDFVWRNQQYSGEIIKKLMTPTLKADVYEVRINQHPEYYRVLFIIKEDVSEPFVLFTYGFTKNHSAVDHKTNFYSLLSDNLYKKCSIHKKGVDYL